MKRNTIIALVVFALLLVGVIVLNRQPVMRGATTLDLSTITTDSIEAISLSGPEETRVALVREEGVWRLDDQNRRLADPTAVDRALEALGKVSTSDMVSSSVARQEYYGVDENKGRHIRLKTTSGDEEALVFGQSVKGGSFLRKDGGTAIFKVSANLRGLFPTETSRWLKLNLIDQPFEDLKAVEVALSGEAPFTLLPAADDTRWRLEDPSILPEAFRFDGAEAMSMARAAATFRASKIIEDEVEDTGLGDGDDRITLSFEGGDEVIHLGGETDDHSVYARLDGRDALFAIPEYRVKKLRKTPLAMRDLHLMDFDPTAVVSVRLDAGSEEILWVKEQGEWTPDTSVSKPPADLDLDPAMVDAFIHSLENLRAAEWLGAKTPRRAGLDRPSGTVELGFENSPSATLTLGRKIPKEEPSKVYCRGNVDQAVYSLDSFQADRLGRGWDLFRRPPAGPPGGMGSIDPKTLSSLPPEIREQLMQQLRQQQQQQEMIKRMQAQQ